MSPIRVIPCLLLQGEGLVKTVKFRDPIYVGDPRNAVRIFNEKQADEIVLLDITTTIEGRGPRLTFIKEIVGEAFMPMGYGGGIRTLEDARAVLSVGVEKAIICTAAVEDNRFIQYAAQEFGSQSIVVCMDVIKIEGGAYKICTHGSRRQTSLDPIKFAILMERIGVGEIIINSIDKDGTMSGFDIDLIRSVADAVTIPVIACGGAGKLEDLKAAIKDGGATGVAAGSMFVFYGRNRAVLINYPSREVLNEIME